MKSLLLSSLLLLGLVSTALADDTPGSPTRTCPVTGEPLGSMGKPYEYIHKETGKPDRVVQLCCKMCVNEFKKNPAKYLQKSTTPAIAP